MTSTPLRTGADDLRGHCEIHLPGDPGYDAVRMPWNLAVDQRPAAVAIPATVEEVRAVVGAATAAGLRIAPQSTGHGAGPLTGRPLDDVVLLRLSGLTGVTVDPEARTARLLGGTQWQDVVRAGAPHGLTALHGSAPDVAVAGFALSGGVSFYGRRHGVAANSVRAVEIVLPDGNLVRASADEHADLFWAVRGAAGNFGIVVAIEIDMVPYPDVYAGMLLWDRERAPEVVAAWAEWTRQVPESTATALRVMSFPPLPELPPFLSGRDVVIIDGAALEDDDRAVEILAPLRALAPELDTFGRVPATAVLDMHMDPPQPVPGVGGQALLGVFDEEAVAAFLGQVGPGTRSGLMFAELRHLGGAIARPAESGGAVTHVPGEYGMYVSSIAPTPEAVAAGRAAVAAITGAMAPWTLDRNVPTFTEDPVAPARLFGDEGSARLRRVRDTYDPDRVMVAHHVV